METSISLDQLAVLFSVMLALFCFVGMAHRCCYLCLKIRERESEREPAKPGRSWFRNVSGTADLDGYYTDEPDGYGLGLAGLAGLNGQAALDTADTHSSLSSSDISQFIWERRQTARPMANADFFNTQVGNDMDWDDSSVFSPPAQASASYYNGAPMHLPVNRHDALVTSTVALSSPPRSSSSSEEPRFDGPRQHAETAPHCAGRKVAPDPRPADPDMDSGIASSHPHGRCNLAHADWSMWPDQPGRDDDRRVASLPVLPVFAAGMTVANVANVSSWAPAALDSWIGRSPTRINPTFQDDEYLEPHPIQHWGAAVVGDSGVAPRQQDHAGWHTSSADPATAEASERPPRNSLGDASAHGEWQESARESERPKPPGSEQIQLEDQKEHFAVERKSERHEPITSPDISATLHSRWKKIRDQLKETNR